MSSSMFISIGDFGKPLDIAALNRGFACIGGRPDDYIKYLEKASFDERFQRLKALWPNSHGEEALGLLRECVLVGGVYLQLPEIIWLPSGISLFRARSVRSSADFGSPMIDQGQLWEPPARCVANFGRLNKPGESYLYVNCGDIETTLDEARIDLGSGFALMAYEVVEPIKAVGIGVYIPLEVREYFGSDQAAAEQYVTLHGLLREEFSRPVECDEERSVYSLSNAIVDEFYSFESCVAYNPVAGGSGLNLRIVPETARCSLALKGVYYGTRASNVYESRIHDYGRWHIRKNDERYLGLEHTRQSVSLGDLFVEDELISSIIDWKGVPLSIKSFRPNRNGQNRLVV